MKKNIKTKILKLITIVLSVIMLQSVITVFVQGDETLPVLNTELEERLRTDYLQFLKDEHPDDSYIQNYTLEDVLVNGYFGNHSGYEVVSMRILHVVDDALMSYINIAGYILTFPSTGASTRIYAYKDSTFIHLKEAYETALITKEDVYQIGVIRGDIPYMYTIYTAADRGGSISPSGAVSVVEGDSQTFTITPYSGYLISDVLVDGVSVGAVSTYTFSNVTENHLITAYFNERINTAEKFRDLKENAWYLDAVDFIVNYGLFEGVSDNEFRPDGNMSRAMFVQVLKRLSDKMGIDTSGNFSQTFKDVKSGAWYEKAISWAAATELVTGYDADTFGPDDSITREQMAVMLIRFVDYAKINLKTTEDTKFSDAGKIGSWAKDAVQRAAAGGLVSGVGGGRFEPLSTAARVQVAKLFGNLVDNYL